MQPGPRAAGAVRATPSPGLGTRLIVLIALLGTLLAACASGAAPRLLAYERVGAGGRVDSQVIFTDGKLQMRHGEVLERLELDRATLDALRADLDGPLPTGTSTDGVVRTLTTGTGDVHTNVVPVPGGLVEKLERLLDGHTIHESGGAAHP